MGDRTLCGFAKAELERAVRGAENAHKRVQKARGCQARFYALIDAEKYLNRGASQMKAIGYCYGDPKIAKRLDKLESQQSRYGKQFNQSCVSQLKGLGRTRSRKKR